MRDGHIPVSYTHLYNNGKWDYKNASDLRYWPTEALDFYAFNPGTVEMCIRDRAMTSAAKSLLRPAMYSVAFRL